MAKKKKGEHKLSKQYKKLAAKYDKKGKDFSQTTQGQMLLGYLKNVPHDRGGNLGAPDKTYGTGIFKDYQGEADRQDLLKTVKEAGTKDADAYDTQYARRSTTATKTNRTVKIQPDGKPGTDTMEQYTAGDYGSFFLSYDASWGADNDGNYPESMGRKVTGVLERDIELTSIDNENPSTVDFIHLCVNGMERLVLQGGDDLIIAQKPVIAYQAYDPKLDLYSHKTTSFDYQEGDYIEPVTLSTIELYLNELGYAVSTFTGFSTYGITYYIAKQG